jgi:hypothetical protein
MFVSIFEGMGPVRRREYVPIAGLGTRWVFHLDHDSVDPARIARAITFPFSVDLLSAITLEKLCQELRFCGFPFGPVETGRGAYATSYCLTLELEISVILARIDESDSDPSQFELGISCLRLIERWVFSRKQRLTASLLEIELWQRLQDEAMRALKEKLKAFKIEISGGK